MKGNQKVMAALQEAIDLEAFLAAQYKLECRDAKRFGLDIHEGLEKLHSQCEGYLDTLVSRVLFYESDPQIAPKAATVHDNVTQMLVDVQGAEAALIERYAEIAGICWEAGGVHISDFHYFQHLIKWHSMGDEGGSGTVSVMGHVSWIQKQLWQLGQFGEKDYLQAKV